MPIIPSIATTPISQEAFRKLAYEVLHQVFAIHDDYGRFFDEIVYQRELARRMAGIETEVGVDVVHDPFSKRYHTPLDFIQWVNIHQTEITLATIR